MEKSAATFVLAVLGLAILYVLSIGPVVAAAKRGDIPRSVCPILYRPLRPVVDLPVAGDLLIRYVEWWNPPLRPAKNFATTRALP